MTNLIGHRPHELVVIWFDQESEQHLLIDGRNRRAAAEQAEVQPTFVEHEGDPIAYILMANNSRRHMTKGQKAMMAAIAYPKPEKGGRGKNSSKIEGFNVSSGYLSSARTVL